MINGKPVVLFIENQRENGCNWYRLRQPCLKLMLRDLVACELSRDLSEDDFALWLEKADVIFTKQASPKLYRFFKERDRNKKVVFDIDDDIFSVDPFNPAYSKRGIKEVDYILPDGKTVKLRDGYGDFNIEENKKTLWLYMECIKESDLVIMPSSILSGKIKSWNKKTKVVKNFIDFNVWKPLRLVKTDRVRIGYQGGWAHYMDFWEIRDTLFEIMKKHENVDLVLMGQVYEGALKDFPQDRIERHGWVGMEAYPYKFMSLGIDIGIAPLQNTDFNVAKSELKWEEYSALGIPSVCSNIPPYTLAVNHGYTGFLCGDSKDWFETLEALIKNRDLRERIGLEAMSDVRKNYSLDENIKEYESIIFSLVKNKEIILV